MTSGSRYLVGLAIVSVEQTVPVSITAAGIDAARVCGSGLSVPGPADRETGRVMEPPIMPGWTATDGGRLRAEGQPDAVRLARSAGQACG